MRTASPWNLLASLLLVVAVNWCGMAWAEAMGKKPEPTHDIHYLCSAWGADGQTVYFIKQVMGAGSQVWFCRMKADGSEKTELAELWPGQNPVIDLQAPSTWLDVAARTNVAVLSVQYGNAACHGIWTFDLEGRGVRRAVTPLVNDKEKWLPNHASLSPDGRQLVFCEEDKTTPVSETTRLVILDVTSSKRTVLTKGPRDDHPVWSPNGDWIVYTHYLEFGSQKAPRRLWLIKPDGSEHKPVVDEKGQPVRGWWPDWSPDATRVSGADGPLWVVELATGKKTFYDTYRIMNEALPWTLMGQRFGRNGWLLSRGYGIIFIAEATQKARMIAVGGRYPITNRWGAEPYELQGGEPIPDPITLKPVRVPRHNFPPSTPPKP